MVKVKVFCSGCTEHLGILDLMKKINENVEFECFGYKETCKKTKEDVRNRIKRKEDRLETLQTVEIEEKCPIAGKTGEALEQFASKFISKLSKWGTYVGYIVVDDLDDNFFSKELSKEELIKNYWALISKHEEKIHDRISENGNISNVIILLAIPEIESWLLYDWDNVIVRYYNDLELTEALQKYLVNNEFAKYWDNFENWCSHIVCGQYVKISEVLIKSFEKIQLWDPLEQSVTTMPHMEYLGLDNIRKRHSESNIKSYNKKKDGPLMLCQVNPLILQQKSKYLKTKFDVIKAI